MRAGSTMLCSKVSQATALQWLVLSLLKDRGVLESYLYVVSCVEKPFVLEDICSGFVCVDQEVQAL